MPGQGGKKNEKKTPRSRQTYKLKGRGGRSRSVEKNEEINANAETQQVLIESGSKEQNVSLDFPAKEITGQIDQTQVSSQARAVIIDGDAVMDMQVGESEDEFFEEDQIEAQKNAENVIGVEKGITGTNNNAVQDTADLGDSKRDDQDQVRDPDLKKITEDEHFMEDFAKFMAKKGYIYREENKQMDEMVEQPPPKQTSCGMDRSNAQPSIGRSKVVASSRLPRQQRAGASLAEVNPSGAAEVLAPPTGECIFIHDDSQSEATVYCRVVLFYELGEESVRTVNNKRDSNSSEEVINTSDESIPIKMDLENTFDPKQVTNDKVMDNFVVAEKRCKIGQGEDNMDKEDRNSNPVLARSLQNRRYVDDARDHTHLVKIMHKSRITVKDYHKGKD